MIPVRHLTRRIWIALLLGLWAGAAAAGGAEPEPLTLRVHDASAPPAGLVAVVLRTYAARPIRQGQICTIIRRLRHSGTADRSGRQVLPVVNTASARAAATGPFATMEGALVFSEAGDAIEQAQFMPADVGQPTLLQFVSESASVNAADGPLLVLYYRLRPDVAPGDVFELSIDPANTSVIDDAGQPVLLESRSGRLRIRAGSDPVNVGAAAEAPDAFDTVVLSMQTEEPIAISSGQLGMRYSRELLPWTPKVRIDPRHGNAEWTLVHTRGLVVVQFSSPDLTLNTVPGDIVSLFIELNPDAAAGADRSIWLDPAYTYIYDSKGSAVNLGLEGDIIP